MTYQLSNPDIETIINYCNNLKTNDDIEISDFGVNGDLVLHICRDEDFNPGTAEYNPITIHVAQNGEWIYNSVRILYPDTRITDNILHKELNKIYNCEDFDIERE